MLPADLPQPLASNFAKYIEKHKSEIFARWSQGVNDDDRIQSSDALSTTALLDHLPQILTELCNFLRRCKPVEAMNNLEDDSETHGNQRWRQGFTLREVVLEIERFRKLLLNDVLQEFASTQPKIEAEALHRIENAIDDFHRELLAGSATEYVECSDSKPGVHRDA